VLNTRVSRMIKEFKNKYVSSLTQIHMSVVLHVVLIKVLATDPLEDVYVQGWA